MQQCYGLRRQLGACTCCRAAVINDGAVTAVTLRSPTSCRPLLLPLQIPLSQRSRSLSHAKASTAHFSLSLSPHPSRPKFNPHQISPYHALPRSHTLQTHRGRSQSHGHGESLETLLSLSLTPPPRRACPSPPLLLPPDYTSRGRESKKDTHCSAYRNLCSTMMMMMLPIESVYPPLKLHYLWIASLARMRLITMITVVVVIIIITSIIIIFPLIARYKYSNQDCSW